MTMPAIGSVWRHYKGGTYAVTGHCRIEESGERAVLYVSTDPASDVVWCRPLREWREPKLLPSWLGHVPRFTEVAK